MLKRRLGIATLALASLVSLATPAVMMARDHDRDDDYRYRRGDYGYYGRMSPHQRHEYEEHMRKQQKQAEKEWRREQRERARYGYGPGYGYGAPAYRGYGNNGGYYDQYGYWHPYRR